MDSLLSAVESSRFSITSAEFGGAAALGSFRSGRQSAHVQGKSPRISAHVQDAGPMGSFHSGSTGRKSARVSTSSKQGQKMDRQASQERPAWGTSGSLASMGSITSFTNDGAVRRKSEKGWRGKAKRKSSISAQLKQRRSLGFLVECEEAEEEEEEEVEASYFEDQIQKINDLLERLRKEHERELALLQNALQRSDADLSLLEEQWEVTVNGSRPSCVQRQSSRPSFGGNQSVNTSRRSSAQSTVKFADESEECQDEEAMCRINSFEDHPPDVDEDRHDVDEGQPDSFEVGATDSEACDAKVEVEDSQGQVCVGKADLEATAAEPAPPSQQKPSQEGTALPPGAAPPELATAESTPVESSCKAESIPVESICKVQGTPTVTKQLRPRSPALARPAIETARTPEFQSTGSDCQQEAADGQTPSPMNYLAPLELPGSMTMSQGSGEPLPSAGCTPLAGRSVRSSCVSSATVGFVDDRRASDETYDARLSVVPSEPDIPTSLTLVERDGCSTKPTRTGTGVGPALPRIAGLKRQGSSLKHASSHRNVSMMGRFKGRQSSVMFDESCDEEDHEHRSSNHLMVPLAIWQPMMEDRYSETTRKTGLAGSLTREMDNLSELGEEVVKTFPSFGEKEGTKRAFMDNFVGHPSSTFNFILNIVSMICISYDLVIIPLGVFSLEAWMFFDVMHAMTTVFWTVDFVRHFFKGHYSQGDVVMSFRRVAIRYLKTWAIFDTCLVCGDWAEWILRFQERAQINSGGSRLLRLLRSARSVRLLRGVKTGPILKMIEDRINSEVCGTIWNMVKLLLLIICACHLMACAWFWIGGVYDASVPNWRAEYLDTHPFGNTFLWQYTSSFHWAITQFTPASIKVQPENSVERIFAICCLLWAFVSMSTFISGLTSAVMQLRQLSEVKDRQFWLLRAYLMEGSVPTKLSVRITNYCQHAWAMRGKRSQEKSVELLHLLSSSLRMELKVALFAPRLTHHAFFMLIQITAPSTIRSTCDTAVTQCEVTQGDDLFMSGEDALHMFFTQRSEMSYKIRANKLEGELITSTDWVCEACLWTHWVYRGTLTAVCDSLATAVESVSFGKILTLSPEARPEAMAYAKSFINGINREPPWKLNDLYTSSLIEGLWFRLMRDFQVSRDTQVSATSVRKRSRSRGSGLTLSRWHRLWRFCWSLKPALFAAQPGA